jgi:peptide-methionine (R)-S-oxide reductase
MEKKMPTTDMPKDNNEWKTKLTPEQYKVLREKGTEAPFSGKYVKEKAKGMYVCIACGNQLFSSEAKLDSTQGPAGLRGWPSFDQALPGAIKYEHDDSYGMNRTEVLCARCGSHLGHIFDDENEKTGKHLCINSTCLDLQADEKNK